MSDEYVHIPDAQEAFDRALKENPHRPTKQWADELLLLKRVPIYQRSLAYQLMDKFGWSFEEAIKEIEAWNI